MKRHGARFDRFELRLADDERAQLHDLATAAGITDSEWIRRAIAGARNVVRPAESGDNDGPDGTPTKGAPILLCGERFERSIRGIGWVCALPAGHDGDHDHEASFLILGSTR